MLKQQVIGIIKLSLPVIGLYMLFPSVLANPFGQIICALGVGAYVWFLNKKQHDALMTSLAYIPSTQKGYVEALITECNVRPETIQLRYAYTGGQVAMTAGNMIIIDPITFSFCDTDPEAIKVKDIFEKQIQASLPEFQKARINELRTVLTPGAERFIIKHELGHFVDNFSSKKLGVMFIAASSAAYAGIVTSMAVITFGGIPAILVGMFVGGLIDIILAYVSNMFFKLAAEKRADRFAVRYSSQEDIHEAAQFFVKQQELLDKHKGPASLLNLLPIEIAAGYQNGKKRAAYLSQL